MSIPTREDMTADRITKYAAYLDALIVQAAIRAGAEYVGNRR